MPIDYDAALQLAVKDASARYGPTDAILYALGLGFGRDPLDAQELRFVFERDLVAVPTLATKLAFAGDRLTRELGINILMLVHGEQGIVLHRALPPAVEALIDSRVLDIFDKGAGKGAVLLIETTARLKESGEKLVTLTSSLFARGDGGFMRPGQRSRGPQPAAHVLPDRAPDIIDTFKTRPDQALLYRLSGDFNPLHADPAIAARAGFTQPILHGLCTYGICCRAILKTTLDYDAARITSFHARFSSPVLPGETITTEIWQDGDVVSFRARIAERGVVAVNNGVCHIAAETA